MAKNIIPPSGGRGKQGRVKGLAATPGTANPDHSKNGNIDVVAQRHAATQTGLMYSRQLRKNKSKGITV